MRETKVRSKTERPCPRSRHCRGPSPGWHLGLTLQLLTPPILPSRLCGCLWLSYPMCLPVASAPRLQFILPEATRPSQGLPCVSSALKTLECLVLAGPSPQAQAPQPSLPLSQAWHVFSHRILLHTGSGVDSGEAGCPRTPASGCPRRRVTVTHACCLFTFRSCSVTGLWRKTAGQEGPSPCTT